MNRQEAIKAIVERRNIKWLVHFTHVNNLLSILENGIIPRAQLEEMRGGGGSMPIIFYPIMTGQMAKQIGTV